MEIKQTRKERLEEKRKKRIPLGRQGILTELHQYIPHGCVGRVFNDSGRRIEDALNDGWEFVSTTGKMVASQDEKESVVRRRVDKKMSGEPLYGYLMVIEEELYNERQAEKEASIKETEADLRRGAASAQGGRIDGNTTYVKTAKFS